MEIFESSKKDYGEMFILAFVVNLEWINWEMGWGHYDYSLEWIAVSLSLSVIVE